MGLIESKPRVLVVEDDPSILIGLVDNLEMEGYAVDQAKDGQAGLQLAQRGDYDVIILDVMLPKMLGFDVCKTLHEDRIRGAILILTARREDRDKLQGFRVGADDYLTKPFAIPELLARVKALLRRVKPRQDQLAVFAFKDVRLDFDKLEASRGDKPVKLTPREFKIMRLFAESAGRVISRNELLDKAWGYDVFPTTRTVDNHIVKLRKAFEDDPARPRHILSVRGVGYRFVAEGETPAPDAEPEPTDEAPEQS